MEQKLAEERAAKLRLENRILELEKHSSMMDWDYKQALQKLDELRRHKDRLTEEVRECLYSVQGNRSVCLDIKCHLQTQILEHQSEAYAAMCLSCRGKNAIQ